MNVRKFLCLLPALGLGVLPDSVVAQSNDPIDTVQQAKMSDAIFKKLGERLNVNFLLRGSLNYGKIFNNQPTTNFSVDEARFEITGKIKPELTYRVRYRINRNAPTSLDGGNANLDIAYVQYLFAQKKMEVTFGKQGANFGSFEFLLNPTFEYKYSDMVNSIVNIFPKAVNLRYIANDHHSFNIQIFNTVNNTFVDHNKAMGVKAADLKASKVPLGGYLLWQGDFIESKFKTRYSYGLTSYAEGKLGYNVALGHQYSFGKIFTYLDLFQAHLPVDYTALSSPLVNSYNGTSGDLSTFARDVTYRTAVLRFDYMLDPKWNLSLKGFYETASMKKNTSFGQDYRKNIGYITALEYKPFVDQSLKFFVNYCGNSQRYSHAAESVAKNAHLDTFSFGFLWYVNALKF